jgi:hypothetical protein
MDSFLTRSAKKLEQALGVPRPWELTPATSVGYQMATGEGSIGERARKGTAQFMGRYITNIKEPYGYDLPRKNPIPTLIKSIVSDDINILRKEEWDRPRPPARTRDIRDTLYRELFDLPSRSPQDALEKTGPKQYTLSPANQPQAIAMDFPKQHVVNHNILGNVLLMPTHKGSYRYEDVWDLVSPTDTKDFSSRVRRLTAPLLRPATVKGEVPRP